MRMPRLDLRLLDQAQIAKELILAGEQTRIRGKPVGTGWTIRRLEFLYELAYLRTFAAWESILEAIFLRTMCGYASSAGQELVAAGSYYSSIADAETAILAAESRGAAARTYLLWQNTRQVLTRCRTHLRATPGRANSPLQEYVIASNQARLDNFAAIRHRIVHEHSDAKTKFDNATLSLSARTYPASRPGKFLRSIQAGSSPAQTWFDAIALELAALARQMV